MRLYWTLAFAVLSFSAAADKNDLYAYIDSHSDLAWSVASRIWEWAEPGYQETRSSRLLQETLRDAGFRIEAGVADIPTAFVASYGEGRPIIGILGEFDALPGLSQTADPVRRPAEGRSYGHACGHHLFGAASMLAAMAAAERIEAGEMSGTIRFYGTPAEEGGAAKVFMVRAGLFDDCDAMLHWHPGSSNTAGDPTNLARIAAKFRYYGESAHAAGAPEQGRSALDAVQILSYASELMREHTPDFSRIHHVITAGGDAPNVVPAFAEAYYYVRHPDAMVAKDLYRRLLLCAEAGAVATETRLEIEYLGGTHNMLPNDTLSAVTLRNLRDRARLSLTPEERQFAEKIQETLSEPAPLDTLNDVVDRSGEVSKGSTDVGDVSWVTPTTGFSTATWVPGTPAHSWQAVAAGGMSIGRSGMLLAAEVIAATAWDLAHDPETVAVAQAELERRLDGRPYDAMLEDGQPPPLDYRNPPSTGGR